MEQTVKILNDIRVSNVKLSEHSCTCISGVLFSGKINIQGLSDIVCAAILIKQNNSCLYGSLIDFGLLLTDALKQMFEL